MSVSSVNDFNGQIAKRVKLANKEGITTHEMMSIIGRGDQGIEAYLKEVNEKPVQEHKSMLDEFQL